MHVKRSTLVVINKIVASGGVKEEEKVNTYIIHIININTHVIHKHSSKSKSYTIVIHQTIQLGNFKLRGRILL